MKRNLRKVWAIAAAVLFTAPALMQGAIKPEPSLQEKVRHELVMLPYLSVFDNLAFQVDDGEVTLLGQVARPILKSDAENVVKLIPGVTSVQNRIEVLPLSGFDNDLRLRVLRSVYSQPMLSKYAWGTAPPIRIIVKNGDVFLEGVVNNETDRNVANMAANRVFGVFSVTNNLQVRKG